MKSQAEIVERLAEAEVRRIVTAVRRDFQSWRDNRSYGPSSGLANAWDEICVQVQGEKSVMWEDGYVPTVIQFIEDHLRKLDDIAKSAIWYQTDNGWNYAYDPEDKDEQERILSECSPDEDVAEYILHQVLSLAGSWSNARIMAYLQSGSGEIDDLGW